MKYGQHLSENIAPEYGVTPYLQYRLLDDIIRAISEKASRSVDFSDRKVSLSFSPTPTESVGNTTFQDGQQYTEETFFSVLDEEMIKVERFTLSKVTELRASLTSVENLVENMKIEKNTEAIEHETELVAQGFLRLEKYVNLNFMGFHKILKKHDKYIPSNPCKRFYINRMHNQSWVQGDYSDLVVRLSVIYSKIRDDKVSSAGESVVNQQNIRRTSIYWVKVEDVSRVKYQVLKHLPVFLQKTATGETDSQLTNSVYLDNDQLELYHSRLERATGGSALRMRWYGTGVPSLVFVERKTHRNTSTAESSLRERFTIQESEVKDIMTDQYDIAKVMKEMESIDCFSKSQAEEWETLAREVTQVIGSKQLVPTLRTQFMRTAFQIPFDASVRITLDTNLCMISERGYNLESGRVWHRKVSKQPAQNEITRFPHAVLEIKLEVSGKDSKPPVWVEELQSSGMLYEVHNFSKFLHGCATLLSEDVRSVPYWVDDISLRDSIISCGGEQILEQANDSNAVSPKINVRYEHLLPFGTSHKNKMSNKFGRSASSISLMSPKKEKLKKPTNPVTKYNENDALEFGESVEEDEEEEDYVNEHNTIGSIWIWLLCCANTHSSHMGTLTSIEKTEPDAFFVNERVFLHWLNIGAIFTAVSSVILALSIEKSRYAHWYAMVLILFSLGFCIHALKLLTLRTNRTKARVSGHWNDPRGPIILGVMFLFMLLINLVIKIKCLVELVNPDARKSGKVF